MTKKSTKRYLRIFVFLMFLFPVSVFAQISYVCGANSATLTPNFNGYVPVTGDQVIWKDGTTVVKTITYPDVDGGKYTTPTSLSDGAHAYTVQVIPADQTLCPGDISDVINIYKLPAPVVLASSSVPSACVDLSTRPVVKVDLTSAALPAGVSMTYTWTVKRDGTTVALSDVVDQTGNDLTMKSGIATGTYVFSVDASYNTGGAQILPAASCKDTKTVTVILTPKPTKPTITVG